MIWHELGIEPTKDLKLIKKTYANQLRIVKAKNDEVAFQSLKEAYDGAIKYAKSIEEYTVFNPSSIDIQENDIDQSERLNQDILGEGNETDEKFKTELIFLTQLDLKSHENDAYGAFDLFLKDKQKRLFLKSWQEVFKGEVNWTNDDYQYYKTKIIELLVYEFYTFPKNVVDYLIELFSLKDLTWNFLDEFNLDNQYLQKKDRIENLPNFSFVGLENLFFRDLEEFCRIRYNIYNNLCENLSDNSKELMQLAQFNANNPDVHTLYFLSTLTTWFYDNEFGLGLESQLRLFSSSLSKALKIDKDNKTAQFLVAFYECLINERELDEALLLGVDFRQLILPENLYYFMMGYLYYKQNNVQETLGHWQKTDQTVLLKLKPKLSKHKQYGQLFNLQTKSKKKSRGSYFFVLFLILLLIHTVNFLNRERRENLVKRGKSELVSNYKAPNSVTMNLIAMNFRDDFLKNDDYGNRIYFIEKYVSENMQEIFNKNLVIDPLFQSYQLFERYYDDTYILITNEDNFEESYLLEIDLDQKIKAVFAYSDANWPLNPELIEKEKQLLVPEEE